MSAKNPELELPEGEDKFCNFFSKLPKSADGTLIRFFDRGSYYSVHGQDAELVAREVFQSQSVVKYLGGRAHQLPSVTMSPTVFRKFLQECLTTKGVKIEIYQSERNKQWLCTKQASPGNLQDVESLLGSSDLSSNPVLMSVKVVVKDNEKTIGTCFTGMRPHEIGLNEFRDNELFSNFESMVIQCGVKECLIQADLKDRDYELRKLKLVLERCGIIMTDVSSQDFSGKDAPDDLTRLLKDGGASASLNQFEMKIACGAAGALIKYLSLMSDADNFGKWTLSGYDLSQYMKLDASALKALSLMPSPTDAGNKSMSVYGLLNRCQTPLGKRLLAQWLHQPLVELTAIQARHDLVGIFVDATGLRDSLQHEHLKLMPDLYKLSKKFQKGAATLEDVVRLYQVVIRLPGLNDLLKEAELSETMRERLSTHFTDKLDRFNALLAKMQDLVETTVDLEALDRHEFLIKPDFDPNLGDLREQIDEIRKQIMQEHRRVGKDLDMDIEKKLKLEDHSVHGYCFRLTRTDSAQIRGRREYSELATAKAGVYFTSPKLSGFAKEFADCTLQYSRHQTGLVREVVTITASYCPVVEELGTLIAELDVLVSFAQVSCHAPTPYIRPTMHPMGQGNTILKEARHPTIEMQDDVSFICNDVELRRGNSEFLIITGANMGGKSTFIRQIGVIALMAQIGCFVPCTEAQLTVFDSILARVGAGDSQLKGVSTFMAEMLETATILSSATRSSLIIIDELGRGTSTTDGFGLAWAISRHILTHIGCFSLFATHFHELTALAEQEAGVRNLHVSAHVGDAGDAERNITLLYKIAEGPASQSFGLHVAELARFPRSVITLAKRKAEQLEAGADDEATGPASKATKTDVQAMRQVLSKWKEQVTASGPGSLSAGEMMQKFKTLMAEGKDQFSSGWLDELRALQASSTSA